jgi:predicted short-subunit dehydrogenase-like oxidoreductase (DUF2520 family)
MIEVIVIGTGNLGSHLCKAIESLQGPTKNMSGNAKFSQKPSQIFLKGYFNRSQIKVEGLTAPLLSTLGDVTADLIIITTTDQSIPQVSNDVPLGPVMVHMSGSVPLDALSKHISRGVYYLPQTFSKNRSVSIADIPACIEYNNERSQKMVELLCDSLSRKRYYLNSKQRKQLHIAAVFTNNFVNHCYHLAQELMKQQNLDESILEPLLKETISKCSELNAYESQTGPARRGDEQTINNHLEMLDDQQKEVYRAISNSIISTYVN